MTNKYDLDEKSIPMNNKKFVELISLSKRAKECSSLERSPFLPSPTHSGGKRSKQVVLSALLWANQITAAALIKPSYESKDESVQREGVCRLLDCGGRAWWKGWFRLSGWREPWTVKFQAVSRSKMTNVCSLPDCRPTKKETNVICVFAP